MSAILPLPQCVSPVRSLLSSVSLALCNENPSIRCPVDHDDVIKWKHFPRYWPFVRGIHHWLVNSPHKGQWRGVLMISLICTWIWVNNVEASDLLRHRAHYDVTVMIPLALYRGKYFHVIASSCSMTIPPCHTWASIMASQITDNSTICSTACSR